MIRKIQKIFFSKAPKCSKLNIRGAGSVSDVERGIKLSY